MNSASMSHKPGVRIAHAMFTFRTYPSTFRFKRQLRLPCNSRRYAREAAVEFSRLSLGRSDSVMEWPTTRPMRRSREPTGPRSAVLLPLVTGEAVFLFVNWPWDERGLSLATIAIVHHGSTAPHAISFRVHRPETMSCLRHTGGALALLSLFPRSSILDGRSLSQSLKRLLHAQQHGRLRRT